MHRKKKKQSTGVASGGGATVLIRDLENLHDPHHNQTFGRSTMYPLDLKQWSAELLSAVDKAKNCSPLVRKERNGFLLGFVEGSEV